MFPHPERGPSRPTPEDTLSRPLGLWTGPLEGKGGGLCDDPGRQLV